MLSEKAAPYEHAYAGLPLVQHGLPLMLHYRQLGKITLEKIVEKMCHAVADCFQIQERGYIREGYFADLVMVDLQAPMQINNDNILYKCGWSPLESMQLPASVVTTMVNGNIVYNNGVVLDDHKGMRLRFNR